MSGHKLKQRSVATRSTWSSLMLRLVLLLAAWQGPIPWCHSHGSVAAGSEQSLNWLGEHLRCYHGAIAADCEAFFGWHIHADFPIKPIDGPDQSPGKCPAEFPVKIVGGSRLADTQGDDELTALRLLSALDSPCLGRSIASQPVLAALSTHFFDCYAATLPLPLRFCVQRC